MVTLSDFQAMSLNEKANAAWEGTFIGDKHEGNLMVQVYNLGTFYAEVFYKPKINEIVNVRGVESIEIIEPLLRSS